MNLELVEKVVTPIAAYLNGIVQVGKSIIGSKEEAPPNNGVNACKPKTKLVTLYLRFVVWVSY
jgi:hypothetical protein